MVSHATINDHPHSQPPELRVFISSTFTDLEEEREHLVKKIFPEVRAVCRDRGVTFTEVDLRWGVTDEEAALGRIVRTCLEEIDRCRPFFIGILGDRYGWTPDYVVMQKDARLLRDHPWIEDQIAQRASIVELEFLYGALMSAQPTDGAFFYVRTANHQADVSQDDQSRLGQLRQRIRASRFPVSEFSGVEALGERVRRDLLGTIDRHWPLEATPTVLMAERRAHAAFAVTRRHAYIANPTNIQRVMEWLNGDVEPTSTGLSEHSDRHHAPLVIVAESGAGKSSLIAYLESYVRRRAQDMRIVAHYVGASTFSGEAPSIVRHVIEEIRDAYAPDEAIPASAEEMIQAFPAWLAKAPADNPMLLMIDAINQLDEVGRQLAWLPEYLPAGVRLLVATVDDDVADRLQQRRWRTLRLLPLTIREREALIVRFLGEYHKGLSLHTTQRIAEHRQATSPLFLRTLLEELRLFGGHHTLEERIDSYLASDGLDDLFRHVLERMEEDFGADKLRTVLSLIACSRHGLSEHRLMELAGISRIALSQLLHALDYHLVSRNGLLDFFHDYLRGAVRGRYLFSAQLSRQWHAMIAESYLRHPLQQEQAGPMLPLRAAQEIPWQWRELQEWERLKDAIVWPALACRLATPDHQFELLGYWLSLGDRYDMQALYLEQLELLELSNLPSDVAAETAEILGRFMMVAGRYEGAERAFERRLSIHQRSSGTAAGVIAHDMNLLGMALTQRGKYFEAEPLLRNALALHEIDSESESLERAELLENLATVLYQRKEFIEAEGLLLAALGIRVKMFGEEHPETVMRSVELGAVYFGMERFDEAQEQLQKALEVCERVYGPGHPTTAEVLANLASVAVARREYPQAIEFYHRAIATTERALGPEHPNVALLLQNLGEALQQSIRWPEAEAALLRAIAIDMRRLGDDHPGIASKLLSLGNIQRDLGKLQEAEAAVQRAYHIRASVFGANHLETLSAGTTLATIKGQLHKYAEAIALYESCLPLKEQILGPDHPRVKFPKAAYRHLLEELSKQTPHDAELDGTEENGGAA